MRVLYWMETRFNLCTFYSIGEEILEVSLNTNYLEAHLRLHKNRRAGILCQAVPLQYNSAESRLRHAQPQPQLCPRVQFKPPGAEKDIPLLYSKGE
jgi:hypothetical protein